MTGAIINAAGIVLGGTAWVLIKKPIAAQRQQVFKVGLGVLTIWCGLKLTWNSINGSAGQVSKQLGIVLLAMFLGKVAGKLMRLQKCSNALGQYATRTMASDGHKNRFDDGFVVATALFCAGPLAILGSVQEGLTGPAPVFWVKAVMDGLATMSFCAALGWGAMFSALPVLAFEGALIRCVWLLEPVLRHNSQMIDSINAVNGLLVFCVAMIILNLKRIEVADYLPSLAIAPLLVKWLL